MQLSLKLRCWTLRTFFLLIRVLVVRSDDITSNTSAEYSQFIRWQWKGGVTSHSIVIKTFPYLDKLEEKSFNTYLFLYRYIDIGQPQVEQIYKVNFSNNDNPVRETQLDSLKASTKYYYSYLFSTEPSLSKDDFTSLYSETTIPYFTFRTLAVALKPASFSFGGASCQFSGSKSNVFLNILEEDLDFFIHMGDYHYLDIEENNIQKFYDGYYKNFASPTQKKLYEKTPILYIYDDHDFGPNNADGNTPGRDAAQTAYLDFAPYGILKGYLPEDDSSRFSGAPAAVRTNPLYTSSYKKDGKYGIFRSFIAGRALFIIMDLRTFKDRIEGDILGEEQMVWLENQFKFVGLNSQVKVVFIVSSIYWLSDNAGEWRPHNRTQAKIGDLATKYVLSKGKQILMIAGDAHMLGFDDGTNNRYGGFPIIQAAPLHMGFGCSGGPFSHGMYRASGSYGVFEVDDDGGDTVCVKIKLKNLGETKIQYDTCNPNLPPINATIQHACPSKQTNPVSKPDSGSNSNATVEVTESIASHNLTWVLVGIFGGSCLAGLVASLFLRKYL